ncbi:MAG TPA: hypothetical protein VHO67_03580 [Polyangia bacterium]|nr:hypothetical protein [Polyangia bacterium]
MSPARLSLVLALSVGVGGCWTQTIGGPDHPVGGGTGGAGSGPPPQRFQITPASNQLDLLLVIDDSANDAAQQKLVAQLPTLVQSLEALPDGLPDLHIGVISTDMGAGPQPPAGCTSTGKAAQLQSAPRGACTDTTLAPGATFISVSGGARNFTAPLEQVLQCITPLGSDGCMFRQPLAAIVRALGADGAQPPAANRDFLRPAAALGILILSTHDDCSPAPGNTDLFTADAAAPGLSGPLGPLDTYRCNRYGHLCQGVGGSMLIGMPPLAPPASAAGTPPSVELASCAANDLTGGRLTTISAVVQDLSFLKDGDLGRIFVSAIAGPPAPYGVAWSPAGAANPGNPSELWPSVMLSCGAKGDPALNPAATLLTTDGTQGEPALRISQFAQSLPHGLNTSLCDASYAPAMIQLAQGLNSAARGLKCIGAPVPLDTSAQPACTVEATYLTQMTSPMRTSIHACTADPAMEIQAPCWRSAYDAALCPKGGYAIEVIPDPNLQNAAGLVFDVSCAACDPGAPAPGCP